MNLETINGLDYYPCSTQADIDSVPPNSNIIIRDYTGDATIHDNANSLRIYSNLTTLTLEGQVRDSVWLSDEVVIATVNCMGAYVPRFVGKYGPATAKIVGTDERSDTLAHSHATAERTAAERAVARANASPDSTPSTIDAGMAAIAEALGRDPAEPGTRRLAAAIAAAPLDPAPRIPHCWGVFGDDIAIYDRNGMLIARIKGFADDAPGQAVMTAVAMIHAAKRAAAPTLDTRRQSALDAARDCARHNVPGFEELEPDCPACGEGMYYSQSCKSEPDVGIKGHPARFACTACWHTHDIYPERDKIDKSFEATREQQHAGGAA